MLLLFLDGVGLGGDDPRTNPFVRAHAPTLNALAGAPWHAGSAALDAMGKTVRAIDPTLGAIDLPQSATGQSTLLTGRDAVAAMGRPYGPWPGPTLERFLQTGTLFHDAGRAGGGLLANAYPRGYLDALGSRAGRYRRARPATAMVAARAAGIAWLGPDDARAGRAVAADFDGGGVLPGAGPVEDAARARAADRQGRRLAALAGDHAFTYLDVWITDQVGHRADLELGVAVVERLDRFVAALWGSLAAHVTLVVTSDHGNLEDASVPRHSRASVPLVAVGPQAGRFATVRDLRDVAPAVRAAWGWGA